MLGATALRKDRAAIVAVAAYDGSGIVSLPVGPRLREIANGARKRMTRRPTKRLQDSTATLEEPPRKSRSASASSEDWISSDKSRDESDATSENDTDDDSEHGLDEDSDNLLADQEYTPVVDVDFRRYSLW